MASEYALLFPFHVTTPHTFTHTHHSMFKSTPALQADAQYVDEYAKLIDRQKSIEVTNHTHTSLIM